MSSKTVQIRIFAEFKTMKIKPLRIPKFEPLKVPKLKYDFPKLIPLKIPKLESVQVPKLNLKPLELKLNTEDEDI